MKYMNEVCGQSYGGTTLQVITHQIGEKKQSHQYGLGSEKKQQKGIEKNSTTRTNKTHQSRNNHGNL